MAVILKIFGWLGSIVALIALVVTLLYQLIAMVGFLMTLIKFAIIRDRSRRRREAQDI